MIKLVYFVSSLKKTGLTSILVNTAVGLDADKYSIYVVVIGNTTENSYEEKCLNNGIKVIYAGCSRFGYLFSRKINNIIKDISPDIIHAHCLRSFIYSSIYFNDYYKVMSLHSIVKNNYRYEFGYLLGALLDKVVDFCIYRHDLAIGVSKSVSDFYHKHKNIKIKYVLNGIDFTSFGVNEVDNNSLSFQKNNDITHIYTGSISERKRVSELVASYANTNIPLLVLGSGTLLGPLRCQYNGFSNIHFMGNCSDVASYLIKSDVYISLSHSEGMPNAVIEALYCGLPCVLSDIPPHQEINTLFPDCIKIVGEGCISENKVSAAATELHLKYSRLSDKRKMDIISVVKDTFSNERMASDYAKIYEEVLK